MNNCLLDPEEFEIEPSWDEEDEGEEYCKMLVEKWSPELEKEMLEAFIRYYYDVMYEQWGPDDPEEFRGYWPEFSSPEEFLDYIGKDVSISAEEDAIYEKSESGDSPYESSNVPWAVFVTLNCPWDPELGWAAAFVDGKFIKVFSDPAGGVVYLD
ncbi:hypothetical protein [Ruminococcus sp.]|uniref:DUF6985 domain-containing protein n=1 Tax=Ruminococcus sp. TaxID=41978 RepID=UPI0025D3A4F3|nr:hypothetical protein [Ruminococcus sp.]MBQ8966391.1 hypothetical protein [Ruminococcus sp.]